MLEAACGICCDVCGLYLQGICKTRCAAGTEERAREKLKIQMQDFKVYCDVLACAVENRVGYCLRDCNEFPCAKFEKAQFLRVFCNEYRLKDRVIMAN
jgi:hypothetical protein